MANVQLHDLIFEPYLQAEAIRKRVAEIGLELSKRYAGSRPVFLIMLKGATVFGMDLFRAFQGEAELAFVRTQSYSGLDTTREVKILLGPKPEEVTDRDIIIVEDVVDSGHTLHQFRPILEALNPKSICVVSLLFKPAMLEKEVKIDHLGFEIPPKFVVGYGLDYNGLGRNLPGIYQLKDS